jgi:hypothetical protein
MNKQTFSHVVRVKKYRKLDDGTIVYYYVRGNITLTIDTEALAVDMANCLYNRAHRAIKAGGIIVAKGTDIQEFLA